MAYTPTFGDWGAVADTYGAQAAQIMQNQGIPLNQVGQYVASQVPGASYGVGGMFPGQLGPGNISSIQNNNVVTGPQGIQQTLAGLLQYGQGGGGQGGGQANPYNMGLVGNPMYSLSQLGAAALQSPMIVNPNPTQNQINPKSGVFSGPMTPQISPNVPTAPKGPWMNTPGIFGGQGQVPTPSGQVPSGGITPTRPYTGGGSPIATPPAAPNMQLPTGGITQGVQGAIQPPGAPTAGIIGPERPGLGIAPLNLGANPTTPGTSTGAMALQNVPGAIKLRNSGGNIPGNGNTDTVPAMLTPGEYVINKQAAQQIGRGKLDALNQAAKPKKAKAKLGDGLYPAHFQDGGSVPDQAAIQEAIAQLPAQEQAALRMSNALGAAGSGSAGMSPLMMKAQQDLQRLLQQTTSAKSSVTKPANQGVPQPQQEQQQGQSGPGGVYYGNPNRMQVGPQAPAAPTGPYSAPQTGGGPGAGGYWPVGSTVYPGQYVVGPSPGAGQSGEILASGDQATQYPTAQSGGGMGATAGIASGIGSALGNLAQAFQNNAKLSWQNIPAGPWANAAQYESQEQRNYGQYEYPMQQFQII